MIKSERGLATSLLETALVITIMAIISSVALLAAVDHIEDARISRASADVESIGVMIHTFMSDTGFAPAYKLGDARGPQDGIFQLLQTGGNDPIVNAGLNWPMADASVRDALENQLISNRPGYSGTGDFTGTPYPRVGQIWWARQKGWNGPYAASMPKSDPWGNRYFVNVQLLTPQGVQAAGTLTLGPGQRPAVFAISAGPNQQLETRFDQVAELFVAGGDDIVFRIQ